MILNSRNKKPLISFGLGKREMIAPPDQALQVWVENVFNEETFSFTFVGVPVTKISNFQYQVDPLPVGVYEISVVLTQRKVVSRQQLKSNTLILTIE